MLQTRRPQHNMYLDCYNALVDISVVYLSYISPVLEKQTMVIYCIYFFSIVNIAVLNILYHVLFLLNIV